MTPPSGMSTRLTFLFALAAGVAVGNLYWAQPLLGFIAGDLRVTTATAGWLVTATQLGYAVGVLLLVPLGDVLDRRRFVPIMLLTSAAALLLCALAPSIGVLLLALGVLGVTTISGQILTPLAGDLAGDAQRGRIVGVVGSGTLTGILASRTISGLVADAAGWRTIFALAAVLAVLLAIVLYRAIPPLAPRTRLPYAQLIASVGAVVVRERAVRWTLVLGATGFAAFSLFWTALTFLLSGPPFRYPAAVIGLFGLAGLAGVLSGLRGGRLHDRGWSLPATGAAWVLALTAFVVAAFAVRSVVVIIIVIVMLDVALQTQALLNRARLFALSHEARSRLNTALAAVNFVGAAIGSAAATVLWSAGGWTAVTIAGTALCCFALIVWVRGRRGPLVIRVAPPENAIQGALPIGHAP
ncbi:Predicted arabinose efflux permease, MFS family [Micromonospora saelicesensis]|uniref:Predicted arabinose efflux permease, MFS family n=2 Tax=Micromonospora saelicesensis TaxID=285676 RepID=A0A1C4TYY6_9ACTN|nr:Predicted arabinose efflux permease, MFS family [Micromonospora saelicesensis]